MSKGSKARKAKLNRGWSHIPVSQREKAAKSYLDYRRRYAVVRRMMLDTFTGAFTGATVGKKTSSADGTIETEVIGIGDNLIDVAVRIAMPVVSRYVVFKMKQESENA